MKKIFYIIVFFLLFNINYSFAILSKSWEKTKENSNIILSIFTVDTLLNIVFAIIAIIITLIISKLITWRVSSFIEKWWSTENREELISVVARTTNIFILSIWFTIALSILGVDVSIFLWGFWFGLWFTLKIFLSNFIAWVVMVTQWSYHNWDLIKIWDKIWNIRKINSLFTEVEQFDWVIFFIPNVKFLENQVENYHINDKRRVEINLWVDYETDLVKAKKIMLQVVENFPNVLKTPEKTVYITKFDNSSINMSLRFWINSHGEYFKIKSNVTETINLAFKQYWIKIPFPQVTLSNRSDFKINLENKKNI